MENLQNLFNPLYAMTDKELVEKLGTSIKDLRLRRGMTQQELADKAGISRVQLAHIEIEGKTSVVTLLAICRVLNLLNPFFDCFDLPKLTPQERFELGEKEQKIINKRPQRIRKKKQ